MRPVPRPRPAGLAAVLLLLAATEALAAAPGWVPFPCRDPATSAAALAARSAPLPPVPFPTTDAEVVRDFTAGYRDWLYGRGWRGDLRRFFAGVRSALGLDAGETDTLGTPDGRAAVAFDRALPRGQVAWRVERAVDWGRARCGGDEARRSAFFLEGTHAGRRLRARLDGAGRLYTWAFGAPEEGGPLAAASLPTLAEAAPLLAAAAGGPVTDLEFVVTAGHPRCDLLPCVAARRGPDLVLLEATGRTFTFPLDAEPPACRDVLAPGTLPCLGAPCPGQPWILVAGDRCLGGHPLGVLQPGGRGR